MCTQDNTTYSCNHTATDFAQCEKERPASDNPYCPFFNEVNRKIHTICPECLSALLAKQADEAVALQGWLPNGA